MNQSHSVNLKSQSVTLTYWMYFKKKIIIWGNVYYAMQSIHHKL